MGESRTYFRSRSHLSEQRLDDRSQMSTKSGTAIKRHHSQQRTKSAKKDTIETGNRREEMRIDIQKVYGSKTSKRSSKSHRSKNLKISKFKSDDTRSSRSKFSNTLKSF